MTCSLSMICGVLETGVSEARGLKLCEGLTEAEVSLVSKLMLISCFFLCGHIHRAAGAF